MEDYYLWLKAFHIIFVIFWCAGLLMMPRYFAYHCQYPVGSDEDKEWQKREASLLRIIMTPSLVFVWVLGLVLLQIVGVDQEVWFLLKFAIILILTILHMFFFRWRRKMAAGERPHSEKFFRIINELPAMLIIIIVLLVILRPF